VLAVILAIVLMGGFVYLTTSMGCAVTEYSGETTSEGYITFNVTVKNYGIEDQNIMVRTIADLHNETYEKRFQRSTVLLLRAGEERTISVTIDTDLQPPAPEVYRAYAFVLPSR
jgi:hypothetical protein